MNPVAASSLAIPPPALPTRPGIDWLRPIGALEPCGPSLEYDHDYAVLRSRLAPRADAQYGSFVDTPESPDWAEIERDCQRLLLRTKDINLLVWWCRARTRLGQAAGLAQVLGLLHDMLRAWPDAVHPQPCIDGEPDPAVRANALAALVDPEGLLADVRDIALASNTALRLTVRDVERAFAMPRAPDAPNPESVTRQLAALWTASREQPQAPLRLLARAAAHVHAIDDWARTHLGAEAPSLHALSRALDLLRPLDPTAATTAMVAPPVREAMHDDPRATALSLDEAAPGRGPARSRDDVLASIRASREWFERHEPSSPVAVLLRQAERMVGKRFSQVADSIPFDLLRRWEAGETALDGEEVRA